MIKASFYRKEKYYQIAHKASLDLNHPALMILKRYLEKAKKVIDLGCGEGTRLHQLTEGLNVKSFGVDSNFLAIKLAKKQYPNIIFIRADLVNLPFRESSFDLAYSAFVFEHLENPQGVLREAARIISKNGYIIIVAPNFGSPNRRSPNSRQNKVLKLISGFVLDLYLVFKVKLEKLGWKKVQPRLNEYIIDADTIIEPYILSLKKYANGLGFKDIYSSTNWSEDKFSVFQLIFRLLGRLNLYPFKYWGPHLCLVLRKN